MVASHGKAGKREIDMLEIAHSAKRRRPPDEETVAMEVTLLCVIPLLCRRTVRQDQAWAADGRTHTAR